MKKQKMFHQNWLNPPRKRERSCSRNHLGWQLSCLRQNRYSVLYSSWGTSHQFENAQALYTRPEWKIWGFIFAFNHNWIEFHWGSKVHAWIWAFLIWVPRTDWKASEMFLHIFQLPSSAFHAWQISHVYGIFSWNVSENRVKNLPRFQWPQLRLFEFSCI